MHVRFVSSSFSIKTLKKIRENYYNTPLQGWKNWFVICGLIHNKTSIETRELCSSMQQCSLLFLSLFPPPFHFFFPSPFLSPLPFLLTSFSFPHSFPTPLSFSLLFLSFSPHHFFFPAFLLSPPFFFTIFEMYKNPRPCIIQPTRLYIQKSAYKYRLTNALLLDCTHQSERSFMVFAPHVTQSCNIIHPLLK